MAFRLWPAEIRCHARVGGDLVCLLGAESGRDSVRAGDREDVTQSVVAKRRGQVRVTAVGFVAGIPSAVRRLSLCRSAAVPAAVSW